MKYIIILFFAISLLQISGCAKKNPFNEPPDAPVIDSLSPAAGFVGTQIRLWGSGFSTYTSQNVVTINGVTVQVDSPSTSTALLVTIIDSTGTGEVNLDVNGKSAVGPVFTFIGTGGAADEPVVLSGKYGWQDGGGYELTVKTLPPTNDVIRVLIAGIDVPISQVTRPGTNDYDPARPNRILLNSDELIESNATVNFAKFMVTYNGIPSNLYAVQIPSRVENIFSDRGAFKFAAGDVLTVQGKFFGDGTSLPSSFYMLRNSLELAQPTFISWTNTEIKATMPAYPELLPDGNVTLNVKVGDLPGSGLVMTYTTETAGTVTLIAGNGNPGFSDGYGSAAQFRNPVGITVNEIGEVFVADALNHRIRKITNITAIGGTVTTFAGDGADGFRDGGAADAEFGRPQGIALDESGNVYVAEAFNNRIRVISGGIVSTFAGDGSSSILNAPSDIVMNNHNLSYISDALNYRIVKDFNYNLVTLAGGVRGFTDGNGANAKFNLTYGLALAPDETLYLADALNSAIRKITPQGNVTTFAGGTQGAADGTGTAAQFYNPVALTLDLQGNLYVAELNNVHIRKISPSGQVTTLYPKGTDGNPFIFLNPSGIEVDAQGVLYITDAGSHNIYRMTQ